MKRHVKSIFCAIVLHTGLVPFKHQIVFSAIGDIIMLMDTCWNQWILIPTCIRLLIFDIKVTHIFWA